MITVEGMEESKDKTKKQKQSKTKKGKWKNLQEQMNGSSGHLTDPDFLCEINFESFKP